MKSNIGSNWVYFSDAEGHLLFTDSEYLRKASSKKRKKKKVSPNGNLDDEPNYNLKLLLKLNFDSQHKCFKVSNIQQLKKENISNNVLNVQKTLKSLAVSSSNDKHFDMIAVGSLGGLVILKINNKK